MALLTQPEAETILSPYLDTVFIQPWLGAVQTWRDFVTDDPGRALALDATARANNIHCWGTHAARAAVEELHGIREVSALKFFAVATGTEPLVRFKYIKQGKTSNVATDQQQKLKRHRYKEEAMAALALEGVTEPPTMLTCGYTLDLIATDVRRVEIRCDYGESNFWRWIIWGEGAEGMGGATVIEPTPLPNMPTPAAARVRSISADRKDAEQQEAE